MKDNRWVDVHGLEPTTREVYFEIPNSVISNIMRLAVSGLNPSVNYSTDFQKMTQQALMQSKYSLAHILSELRPFIAADLQKEAEAIIQKYMIDSKEL